MCSLYILCRINKVSITSAKISDYKTCLKEQRKHLKNLGVCDDKSPGGKLCYFDTWWFSIADIKGLLFVRLSVLKKAIIFVYPNPEKK